MMEAGDDSLTRRYDLFCLPRVAVLLRVSCREQVGEETKRERDRGERDGRERETGESFTVLSQCE